jgi:hypothetical protein
MTMTLREVSLLVSPLVLLLALGAERSSTSLSGEIEDEYVAITGNQVIPTWPIQNPYRWNVLLDALIVNGVSNTITPGKTRVQGAPTNKAVVLLDSGSSYTSVDSVLWLGPKLTLHRRYAPPEFVEKIYGNITGASLDTAAGYWRVPCDQEVNMAIQLGFVSPIPHRNTTLTNHFQRSSLPSPPSGRLTKNVD